ncbi:MAG: anthranilate synthase component I family protein [Sphingobium sp.]|nr:anthranilate synthase component I family protein [Sphingobium sp.]
MQTYEPVGSLTEEIDWIEPEAAFARLAHLPGIAFLDSVAREEARAGTAYLCVDPAEEVIVREPSMGRALDALSGLLNASHHLAQWDLPFKGGLVGMMSYETGLSGHDLVSRHRPDPDIPAFVVRRYDLVIGFDLLARRAWIFAADRKDTSAADRTARLADTLAAPKETLSLPPAISLNWREQTPYSAYAEKIAEVKRLIVDGDIYQANISTRFVAQRPAGFDEGAVYLKLRSLSAAPFAAFLDLGEGSYLLSASPERFVQLNSDGAIETRPIKGTAPRHADPQQDEENALKLASSEKDRAENLMICDLLRNDLSMVAVPGSVKVPQLVALEGFASVWHLVSVVTAQLAPGKSAVDMLAAVMPGGSITGAPKRRAMEIIDAIEGMPRGPNYGCLFWIGADGAMDSSIIIRSLVTTPERIIAQAGGGIVADSSAEGEYAELRTKIAPLLAVGYPEG